MTGPRPRRPMDPVDVLLLKQGDDPRRRTMITAALQLEATPDWTRLIKRVEHATSLAPRLRQKVVSPLLPLGLPVWVDDRDFDLRYHLRRARVASPGSATEVLEFAESFAIDSLDPGRPLWQAFVLEDDDNDRPTLLIKVSHALMDGLSGIELLAAFVDLEPDPPETTTARPPAHHHLTALGLTAERLVAFPWNAQRRYLRNAFGMTRTNTRMLAHPKVTTGEAASYAGSLKRLLTAPAATGSCLLQGRSAQRRLVTVEMPQAVLRAAGKAAGGSLNDAYLAGVLGALRRYHEALDSPVHDIPFAIPVSTRGSAPASEAGNRFSPVRFAAPMGLVDPAGRIRRIAELVRAARGEPALDAMTSLAPALAQLPAVILGLLGREQDKLDAQASNVPGPPFPVFLAGAEVTRLFAFGPLPGPGVMAVLVTYAGTCCIGFTLDTAAVTDIELFERCAREGFAEVLALDPSSHAPVEIA